jgi:multidrug efflux pump subunit AcrB
MNLGRLSINQPILAMVLSIVLLIVGAIAYTTLPVAEYPQVAPPTVVVTTQYPGASAQTVSDTVATPIEQEINGVEDMLYLYSQATSNGQLTITVTFKLGTSTRRRCWCRTASRSRSRGCPRKFSATASSPARTARIC